MNKIIPITNIILSFIALAMAVCGISLAIVAKIIPPLAVFAIVIIIIGFTISVINSLMGFVFIKSKLCLTGGIISAVAIIINIAAFIVLM